MYPEEERRHRRRLLKEQPLSRLFPNLITIAGLCCGLSALRFAMLGKWEMAVASVFAAALIDGMDGRIARLLGATSIFGAQLDSLSDFVCFGVVPPLVLYHWRLNEVKGFGWAVVLFFTVCCALRLARFNTGLITTQQQPWQKKFFTGVPSPAGGILCLLPLVADMQFDPSGLPLPLILVYVLLIAILMASRIPTFAAKNVRVKPELILPVTVAGALAVVSFVIEPWLATMAFSLIYLAAIPASWCVYRKLSRAAASGSVLTTSL